MDLLYRSDTLERLSDPRTSGDGPGSVQTSLDVTVRPPHERGWTYRIRGSCVPEIQTPARAGMDRRHLHGLTYRQADPRTSGDGPYDFARVPSVNIRPPHERGWTHALVRRRCAASQTPARAGMDLPQGRGFPVPPADPRTSGDGPSIFLLVLVP